MKALHQILPRPYFILIREQLIDLLEIDEDTYNHLQFELGIEFLNEIYPENSEEFRPYFQLQSRSKQFWKWWKYEWAAWQMELLNHANQHGVSLNYRLWHDEMRVLAHDPNTENSFNLYLKIFRQ